MATADVDTFVSDITAEYREKMADAVEEAFSEEYFDELGGPEAVMKHQFCSQGWREFYIGTLPPARQMTQIYDIGEPYGRDRDLIVGLGKQIRDEVKHARILANLSERLDVPCDLATWEGDNYDALVRKCRTATEWDKPHYIAAGFQASTEIVAAKTAERMAEYVQDDYPDVAQSLQGIASDEGDHIHCGRLIIKRFATPEDIPRMEEIAQEKYASAVAVLESL